MGQMPTGNAYVEYDEVCMIVAGYAERLCKDRMSYADMIRTLDRLTNLRDQAKKLWGDR